MKWMALLFIVAGCGYANKSMVWPLRGSFLEVHNPTEDHQVIVARDGQGREWQVARVKPHGRHASAGRSLIKPGSCARMARIES